MKLWDGTEIFYREWLPDSQARPEKALILFHRGHEHSGRFQDVVEALNLRDFAVFAWDARGHGRSPGDRGWAPSFGAMVKDADCFVRHIAATHQLAMENIAILAHSVGAVTIAAWVHDYAPPIRAMVLATPALRVKLYIPLAIPGLRALQWWKGSKKSFVKSYVKAKMLTHDAEQAKAYDSDPLIAKSIAVNILLGLYDGASRVMDDAGAITVPTMLLAGGADWVVKIPPQERFFRALSSKTKEMHVFPGMYHDILHEKDRHLVIAKARQFIVDAFARPPEQPSLLDAHERGYTRGEYERLTKPLPGGSPKTINFAMQRFGLKTGGKLSEGVKLGWRTGFDSGESLDYVYENMPRGKTFVGRMIDKNYLNAIGWRGIRQRKLNLETLLLRAIQETHDAGRPVRILDVATGCGRYVLDAIKTFSAKHRDVEITALLRDHEPRNIEAGTKLAKQMGLADAVTFEEADAFDEVSLAEIDPPPTIAIVSGLYELFPDNTLVLRSLRGIAAAMKDGGLLIYTGQPWHPQVEMIARVLINRDGDPWIMRRRTQAEMDELVHVAGFEKQAMEIDEWGIFTVSLARRRGDSGGGGGASGGNA